MAGSGRRPLEVESGRHREPETRRGNDSMKAGNTLVVLLLVGTLPACTEVRGAQAAAAIERKETGTVPPSTASKSRGGPAAKTPKQECEVLLNAMLPFAEKMLVQHRQLLSFGGALTENGQIVFSGRPPRGVHPASRDWTSILERGYQAGARAGRYRATSIVSDARVIPPGKSETTAAIAFRLDHRDGFSVVVYYPYALGDPGSLAIEAPFSIVGERTMFR